MRRRNLVDSTKHSLWTWNVKVCEKVARGLPVYFCRISVRCQDRFYFRSENEAAIFVVVVERFDSKMVTCENEFTFAPVKERECEHSVQTLNALCALFLIQMQNHFRICS